MTVSATLSLSRHEVRSVGLVTLGHSLTHWYPATFFMLLPLIGQEMGLSYSQIGFIMSCQFAAGALSNVPGGMLVDMWRKKGQLMALSLFWVGFPYLLMGFTHQYWMLLLCVMLVGVGNNLWHPTAIPLLGRMFPQRKGLVLSLHGMGGNFGDAMAPLVVGALLTTMSWRDIVILNVVPGTVMAFMMLYFLGGISLSSRRAQSVGGFVDTAERQSLVSYVQGLKDLFRAPGLLLLNLSSSFRSMTQGTLLTFLPLYLAHELKFSVFWVGAGMALLQMAGFVAAPIAGHLSDTMGRRNILMSCFVMTAMVLLAMTFAGQSVASVVLIAVLGFFLFAVRPIMQAWMLEASPKNMGGTAIGLMFGMQSGAQAFAPVLGGLIADRYGLMAVFYLLAATIVLANLMVFLVPTSAGREQAKA